MSNKVRDRPRSNNRRSEVSEGKPSQTGNVHKYRITSQENNQSILTSSDVYLKGRQTSGRSVMTLCVKHSVSASVAAHV
ncbi:hypothetical protein XELAEV_18045449mg [Xenopus laevis]|uniref:Uncharacterized protein n=1 Tax=Xenopus laevis TaxID=8355 RepID=A0A974C0U7_XENLA|nr:hypothetical protein XELAEV_18045449mg [Xenopus laevis]